MRNLKQINLKMFKENESITQTQSATRKKGHGVKLLVLILFSLFLAVPLANAQSTVSSVKRIEISSDQTTIITQTTKATSCQSDTPSFSVSPIFQEGKAGDTLIYNLNIKNNDIGCAPRSFLITGQAPLVNGEMWDIHFYIYGANRYPEGERRSNFVLDPQENPTVKIHITSKEGWPDGEYLHISQLNYGDPGEEINLAYNLRRNLTYKIISSGTKKCPVGCICDEGGTIKCPFKPVCEFPCVVSGETCTCPVVQTKTCKVGCICEGETIKCPTEPICEPPCIKSGDTCSCPVLPTKVCKVGCVCDGDTMKCPAEPSVCNSPCVQSGDTCSCPIEPTKICPVNCVCEGETITCPTTEAKVMEAKIFSIKSGIKSISIEKKENKLSIKTDKAEATTKAKLSIEGNKLFIETKTGYAEVKILPEEASSKAKFTAVQKIELTEESQKPIYFIQGSKQAKILFVFPVNLKVSAKINAGNGEIIAVKKPWWSFLAW